jgi:multiple antibiotic resistance protein
MAEPSFLFDLAKAIIVLFIIVDPFGSIPIFIGLTESMTENAKRKVFNVACLVGFVLLLVFSILGQTIFSIFGVDISSFEVAGGILLLIISIRILVSGSTGHDGEQSPESLGAVPIAIPLLVGPGAITTTIINLQLYSVYVAALSVLIVIAITWVILRFINNIYRFLGKTGTLVIARVMALIIAAIAVQYILTGTYHYLFMTH